MNTAGYLRVAIQKDCKPKKMFVHRLVAMNFIENPLNLAEVNHKDGNRLNNHVSNLEWCDRIYNERDLIKRNKENWKPFLVQWFDREATLYDFPVDLARELNLTTGCIRHWLKGRMKSYTKYGIEYLFYL